MAFIKFTETGKSFSARSSISPKGMIGLNDGARRKFCLERFSFAVLYYDSEKSMVGIELTNDENAEGAIKIRLRTTGADIAAKSFFDFFEIAPTVTTVYSIKNGEHDNWIIVDLNSGKERKVGKDD
jgi:hypothetical protein